MFIASIILHKNDTFAHTLAGQYIEPINTENQRSAEKKADDDDSLCLWSMVAFCLSWVCEKQSTNESKQKMRVLVQDDPGGAVVQNFLTYVCPEVAAFLNNFFHLNL